MTSNRTGRYTLPSSRTVQLQSPFSFSASGSRSTKLGKALHTLINTVRTEDITNHSLRTHDALESDDGEYEERGVLNSLKELTYWALLKKGMNHKKLGLQGLNEKAYLHKNYQEYIDFSVFWRKHN
ncbi:hypothetical protein PHYSODRAFT_285285 [Phytophthora sojae]|uniref:RxLR effector protein n=1 Tax=Phytophthora sojae (strain P6497) TaxID=1094619 RepID=G4Z517_PHYSP|nr:hypothetical protein PHYSODRAFT_285285 [Phytophthora sojae]EGZ19463.1 hypothetical protein PHYSODRAFT_285285 [Phytophthora sojae]|eukprot:XP_009522180.1 hypothetical protein PHYSODRAFT_285285 [Phytophthora sojae]